MIEIGTVLQDRFLIEVQVGVGGMGAVYRAVDQKFGTAVAIKETFYRDKDLAEAFEREARLLNGLHHPLFPHVSDHFTEGDGHFLVMEYIEGEDLSALLKRGERFTFETAMRWTLDLLDGLDHLHSQDPPIIHRDIKPSNLKLTSRGNIVLLDFGMAKETSGNTQGMRSVFGYSRRYSPLEQIEGAGTDERSDIFSLGATVFHLLTATPPVDVLRRASAIVAGRPDPIRFASDVNPEVPDRVAEVIDVALALDPGKRFPTARAMWAALERCLGAKNSSKPITALPPDWAEVDDFPAVGAFEPETANVQSPVSIFRTVAEDDNDPFAALVAQRVAEMKAAETCMIPEAVEKVAPARIEVPVVREPEPIHDDVEELGTVDEPEPVRTATPMPVEIPPSTPVMSEPRFHYRPLLFLPLVLVILGFVSYLAMRGGSDGEATQGVPERTAGVTEGEPADSQSPAPLPETADEASDSSAVADVEPASLAAEPEPPEETTPSRGGSSSVPDVSERSLSDKAGTPTRPNRPARRQDQAEARVRDRNNRATRSRIVEEEEFEQPPVSSIESIMTGIPAERPRRQRRWEVLEEDLLPEERRRRRINRRNRQRQNPLF